MARTVAAGENKQDNVILRHRMTPWVCGHCLRALLSTDSQWSITRTKQQPKETETEAKVRKGRRKRKKKKRKEKKERKNTKGWHHLQS